MGFTPTDRADAAGRLSSAQESTTRTTNSSVDVDEKWELFLGRSARALASDSQIALYLQYLCSNRARVAVIAMSEVLEALITSSEGQLQAQPPLTSRANLDAATTALSAQAANGYVTDEAIARVNTEGAAYVQKNLGTMRTGKRLQPKGAEAHTQWAAAFDSLRDWDVMLRLLRLCTRTVLLDGNLIRVHALKAPATNLSSIPAGTPATASSHILDTLGGLASISTLSAPVSPVSADLSSMAAAVETVRTQLPTATVLKATLKGYGTSAADTRERSLYLAQLVTKLHTLSADAEASLLRQGAEPPSGSAVSAVLLAFSPSLSGSTKRVGREMLDTANSQGFDRATSLLTECEINAVFKLKASDAAFAGQVTGLARSVTV